MVYYLYRLHFSSILRVTYQAGHCWAQMMIKNPELPLPSEWGWKKIDGGWEPY